MKYGSIVVVNGLINEMKNFVLNVVTMSNNKQTAVAWLSEQLWKTPQYETEWQKIIEQAKEMEKQQIIKAFDKGADIGNDIGSNYDYHEGNNQGYQYYNQEYGI